MRKQFAVLCFVLLSAASVLAESSPQWLEVKTEHFTVLSDNGERQVRHVAGQLERMHDVFAKLLPHAGDDQGSRIIVLALKDRKGFQAVEPASYLGKDQINLAGLFMRGADKSYILLRMDTSGEHPYSTVYHEYTHYMVRHVDYLPVWLNEGLAQFYQNTDILDKYVNLGQPDANQILFLRQQRLIPLNTLFLVDHNSPYYHEENKGNIFYAESWALTHFLFIQDFGTKNHRLADYAQYVSQGEGPVAAAQHAFGDLNRLQSDLDSYINHGEYKQLTMALQNAVDEKSLEVHPVASADANAVRADVLTENGRPKEAEALIDVVLREAPNNAQAHESMGLIKLREGDMQAARKWYGEAVALHSESFLAYYYFGTLSMGDEGEAAGESLRECVKLNPSFAPGLESLMQFDVRRHEQMDEALAMSVRAVQLDPRNIGYRLNAAEVRMARNEIPAAVSILEAAAKVAHNPEDRARVQARLEQVQRYEGQLSGNEQQH